MIRCKHASQQRVTRICLCCRFNLCPHAGQRRLYLAQSVSVSQNPAARIAIAGLLQSSPLKPRSVSRPIQQNNTTMVPVIPQSALMFWSRIFRRNSVSVMTASTNETQGSQNRIKEKQTRLSPIKKIPMRYTAISESRRPVTGQHTSGGRTSVTFAQCSLHCPQ